MAVTMEPLRPLIVGSPAWLAVRCGWTLWTEIEINVLLKYYPNRNELTQRLPNRTFCACRNMWQKCAVKRAGQHWTASEIDILKRKFLVSDWASLLKALPYRSKNSIRWKARTKGLVRPRKVLKKVENDILDAIRQRSKEMGISLQSLDEDAGSVYFFQHSSRPGLDMRLSVAESALKVLGGRLQIAWED